jgi:hypothetical protein
MEQCKEDAILQALRCAEGNRTWAAARCNMTRAELCACIDASPALQAAVAEIEQRFFDMARIGLETAIAAGKRWAFDDWQRHGFQPPLPELPEFIVKRI